MPLYEYRCTKCAHEVEVLQKFSDKPLRRCEKCSGKLEKLISRTSFQLKGGGWYEHGYGSKSASDAGSKSETSSASPSTPADKTTDKPTDKATDKATDKPKKKSTKAS